MSASAYLDYDRKKYPHIARSEKRALNNGWTQAECDHVRETISLRDHLGTREDRLRKEDDALRISEENGISSAEWARQRSERSEKSGESEDYFPWAWVVVPIIVFALITGYVYFDLHFASHVHHAHNAVPFE
jgi:hypothetical protein